MTKCLKFILLLGFLLRVWAAVTSIGFSHPNENYRLLEPLAAIQGFETHQAWEWSGHYLSELPVRAHGLIVSGFLALGIHGPTNQSIALRLLYAILGLLPILATRRLIQATLPEKLRLSEMAALLVAIWPEFIFGSVRLMDYSLEAAGLSAALLLAWRGSETKKSLPRQWGAGAILGTLFFVKPQSGLYLIAWCIADFLSKTDWRKLPWALITGYGSAVLFLGLLDPTPGGFLHPFRIYVMWNIQNAAAVYGADPWHRYFTELGKIYGWIWIFPLTVFSLFPFFSPKARFQNTGIAILFWLPFFALTSVAHKEGRFLLGFAFLLLPAAFVALEAYGQVHRNKRTSIVLALCLFGSFLISANRVSHRWSEKGGDLREWERIGQEIQLTGGENLPIEIDADPDFSPGGFFLRHKGPLCYLPTRNSPEACALLSDHRRIRMSRKKQNLLLWDWQIFTPQKAKSQNSSYSGI